MGEVGEFIRKNMSKEQILSQCRHLYFLSGKFIMVWDKLSHTWVPVNDYKGAVWLHTASIYCTPTVYQDPCFAGDLKWYGTFPDLKEFTVRQSRLSSGGWGEGCLGKKNGQEDDVLLENIETSYNWQWISNNINITRVFMRRKRLRLLQAIFEKLKKKTWHFRECRILGTFGGTLWSFSEWDSG